MANRELLVGDIGGTNARFAVSMPDGTLRDVQVLKVADHEQFDRALEAYLDTVPNRPAGLCIASAGAKQGDEIHLTNAPWSLGEKALAAQFHFSAVQIINDFQAQARFAGTMQPGEGTELKPGTPVPGTPVLTVGPGTGFGQALFVPGHPHRVVATEGGHRLMPVRNDKELRFVERMREQLGHAPILEDALSGRGIVNLYQSHLADCGEEVVSIEPPAITEAALAGPGHAREALCWFLDILACACADACVATGARGGVVISGGIVPRLTGLLAEMDFAGTFARAGILQDYLSEAPVSLITEPYAALYGTASYMRDSLG
ncbi:MAG: ROK family protein [Parvularculaceae bacterium]|nr:ROK family protein [Parvularculaceae bacterium]